MSNYETMKTMNKLSIHECALQCAHALEECGIQGLTLAHINIIIHYLDDWRRVNEGHRPWQSLLMPKQQAELPEELKQ